MHMPSVHKYQMPTHHSVSKEPVAGPVQVGDVGVRLEADIVVAGVRVEGDCVVRSALSVVETVLKVSVVVAQVSLPIPMSLQMQIQS